MSDQMIDVGNKIGFQQQRVVKPELVNPTTKTRNDMEFNPRRLITEFVSGSPESSDFNYGYHNIDTGEYSMKLINLSGKTLHIGYRNGSVITLQSPCMDNIWHRKAYKRLRFMHKRTGEFDLDKFEKTVKDLLEKKGGRVVRSGQRHDSREEITEDHLISLVPKCSQGLYIIVTTKVEDSLKRHGADRSSLSTGVTNINDENVAMPIAVGNTRSSIVLRARSDDPDYERSIAYQGPSYYKYTDGDEHMPVSDRIYKGESTYRQKIGRQTEMESLEYFIPNVSIDSSSAVDSTVYVEQFDISIACGIPPYEVVHPYSEKGRQMYSQQFSIRDMHLMCKDFAGGFIAINVYNEDVRSVPAYYINSHGDTHMLTKLMDNSVEPGVYIYKYGVVRDGVRIPVEYHHIKHDEISGFMLNDERVLFTDREEARRESGMKAYRERLKEELKKEYDEKKRKLENEYMAKYAINKVEEAKKKAYYEERSYARKDTSELLKFTLTTVTVLAAVLVPIFI